MGSIPRWGRSTGERYGNPLQYSGLRSLAGYSPWGHEELDTTGWLTLSLWLSLNKGRTFFVLYPLSCFSLSKRRVYFECTQHQQSTWANSLCPWSLITGWGVNSLLRGSRGVLDTALIFWSFSYLWQKTPATLWTLRMTLTLTLSQWLLLFQLKFTSKYNILFLTLKIAALGKPFILLRSLKNLKKARTAKT